MIVCFSVGLSMTMIVFLLKFDEFERELRRRRMVRFGFEDSFVRVQFQQEVDDSFQDIMSKNLIVFSSGVFLE